ncbi:MAG: HIT family protein [Sneathiella sp.]|uniref:HIT family protein n=1 Tax=Sneathiella sp. TaxID=1964365 RepID=UPI003001D690
MRTRLRGSVADGKNLLFFNGIFVLLFTPSTAPSEDTYIEAAMFDLHPQLANDTETVLELDICRVLLMNDSRYPWIILVPRQENLVELHDLDADIYPRVMAEIRQASRLMKELFSAHKVNVGALGNMVSQLHIHVVARHEGDVAWPGPVWGVGTAIPYSQADEIGRAARIRRGFDAYKTS